MHINVTKQHNGLLLNVIHGGYYVHKLYVGYSKRDAVNLFKQYLRSK